MYASPGIDTTITSAVLTCELLTAHIDDWEQMSYTTYGIRVLDNAGAVVFECADISTSREYVQGFLDVIKGHDISPVHIKDLLEDYLD